VSGGAEGDALPGIGKVGFDVVVRIQKSGQVNKVVGLGNCARAASHGTSMPDDSGRQHEMSGIRSL